MGLGIELTDGQPVLYHLLVKEMPHDQVAVEARPNLFVIPSNELTALAENQIKAEMGTELFLFNSLGETDEYDYILVDCPPSLNELHKNALYFAEEMIIPIDMDRWAVNGALRILESADRMYKAFRRRPEIRGVIPWKIDMRTSMTHMVSQILQQSYGDKLLPSIRCDETFKKAAGAGKTIFEYSPRSKGAIDFELVIDALIAQENPVSPVIMAGGGVDHSVTEHVFA
jgi:chromosome partitioning protein